MSIPAIRAMGDGLGYVKVNPDVASF
jgi:hypothetical protein